MQYVITAPEALAATATDVARIGTSIEAASAAAAASINGVPAAAEDEVSTAVAKLFGLYGQEYQALVGQAAAFHSEFSHALAAAGNAYALAETGNAAVVSGASNALIASVQALIGQTPTGSGASPAATIALILGGTGNPLPDLDYVLGISTSYVQRLFPGAIPMGLFTPEMFWPVTPQLGAPFSTFGQSVAQGVSLLNAAIHANIGAGPVVVFGYSQSVNAIMGYFFVHNTYPFMTATQVANAVPLPTSPGYTGHTSYYMFMTQDLPLLQPIRDIPYAGPPIADIFEPDLRVLVDLGYADYGTGANYANIPTPSGLFSVPNPFTVIPDLITGAWQGPYAAAVEIGVESGLVSPSYFPTAYPWVPSVDPHLNFFLGQPSTTLLSTLSGDLGDILEIIPPVFNLNITT
jgi:hypothetical protein